MEGSQANFFYLRFPSRNFFFERIITFISHNEQHKMEELDLSKLGKNRIRKKTESLISNIGKVPPQNIALEEAVLGAVLLEKEKLSDVTEILPKPECFYVDAHQKIYGAILDLLAEGSAIDMLTVTEKLNKLGQLELIGGPFTIAKLTNAVISSANVVSHARIVMEKFIQRELIKVSSNILTASYEEGADIFELLDKAETDLFEISNNYLRNDYQDMGSLLIETLKNIEEAKNQKETLVGVPTGYNHLDHITAGWQKTDLIILAARPSVGKTAFALNLAINAALDPVKPVGVALFSLEMSCDQLVRRMLSMTTEVPLRNISRGQMSDMEFLQLTQRSDKLAKAKLFLDDQAGLNIFELRAKCRRLKDKHDIGIVIIDYLQLMQGSVSKGGNREQEISKISRELKGLAKDLGIPIIALSQLSRALEQRGDKSKMPQLSDLRESGAIEQDADMVCFLYRPEYHGVNADEQGESIEGLTFLNIAKHRNGSLEQLKFRADLSIQKFYELEDGGFGQPVGFGGSKPQAPFGGSNSNSKFKADYSDDVDSSLKIDESVIRSSKANKFKAAEDDESAPF